ncbi:MAG: alpha/beta hydrolase [Lachnospiraceae bacterium]|nr:alpha/beta hydrolase [Lachnospiraceae bacterium]
MKKHNKIKKIILFILAALAVLLIGLAVFHRCKLAADKKNAEKNGYYNLVSAGNYSLNVVRFGKEDAGEKIVVLSGMGPGFPVEMRQMSSELEKNYEFIYVARAGWDGSDDVKDERTVDTIVEDYRKALKSSGVQTPYILLSHSMGSTYASYWVSKYPDEIEAFVNIDGTYVEPIADVKSPKQSNTVLLKAAVNLGLGDVFFHLLYPKNSSFSKEEQRIYDFLALQSADTVAGSNESAYIATNRNETWNALVSNDVPKLYISSRDGDDSAESKEIRDKELTPYLEKMGNFKIEYLPGSHFIYKTEPQKCGEIIQEFLDGKKPYL